jgi:hypothetical protein
VQRAFARQDRTERLGHGKRRVRRELEQCDEALAVDFARQAAHFVAARPEYDQCGIAAHLEALGQLLRAGAVAVDVQRHQRARRRNHVGTTENARLEAIAWRAPGRSPIQ